MGKQKHDQGWKKRQTQGTRKVSANKSARKALHDLSVKQRTNG